MNLTGMSLIDPTSGDPVILAPAGAQRAGEWAERGMGTRGQHQFFYWLMRLGGIARGYHMANIVAGWYVLISPSIRRRCGFYLRRRFPERTGSFQRLKDTYWLVRGYATTLVDIKVRAMFGAGKISVECPDRERLAALSSRPGGFVLIHGHVGCWQVGMTTLSHLNKNVGAVMIPDRHTMGMLGERMSVIDPRTGLESSLRMTETILAGDILVMMGDRTIGGEGGTVEVDFLGGRARFPVTPYRIASATGAPVVVMTAPRVGKRAYELRVAAVIEVPAKLGRAAESYRVYAQQFADCLAGFVEEFPWQFHNFFDLW
jgi:predicted LPLAT superfamily acyltransferase